MRSGIEITRGPVQDHVDAHSTVKRGRLGNVVNGAKRGPRANLSPAARCSDNKALAKHLIKVAEDAYVTGDLELSEHFIEIAHELFDRAFG
jgi:hypothetical protein